MIKKSLYGKLNDGRSVYQFSLHNKSGTQINIINYGAIVTNIFFRDKKNIVEDIVLGYDSLQGYLTDKTFMGAIVGRYGNRIKHGRFKIGEEEFQLSINNGSNHLHGGPAGFYKTLWNAETVKENSEDSLRLSIKSVDGEEGYPGNLFLTVIYTLTDDDELKINYEGRTDKSTILNPTHHSYFNLTGDFTKNILDHYLQLESEKFTPVDEEQIPTGEIKNIGNTPFDFRRSVPIGLHINDDDTQLKIGNGFDHNWVLNNFYKQTRKAAELYEPLSGRLMEVFTDQPGMQFYSGNSLDGNVEGKNGIKFNIRTGLCLEAQLFPDSPNISLFPSAILNPGEIYRQETTYKFSIKN